VISDVHFGDWGLQMGQLITELKREQPDLPYFDEANKGPYPNASPVTMEDLERIYPKASAACKADPERLDEARKATAELQAGRPGYRALWEHFRGVSFAGVRREFDALASTSTGGKAKARRRHRSPHGWTCANAASLKKAKAPLSSTSTSPATKKNCPR
jgi:arginyl-tRNA synthetase